MFNDSFYQIDRGEIFIKSSCMQHERALFDFFGSMLTNLGYTKTENFRIWQRDDRRVVVCFADDFGICRRSWALPPSEWFDKNTTIITDNHVDFPTDYNVQQLPESYFGVFNYQPENQLWTPSKRFNFSVNRLDNQRLLILLELLAKSNNTVELDLINFNCWSANRSNNTLDDVKQSFNETWNQLEILKSRYTHLISNLTDNIPIRNHNLTIEQAHTNAWINVVVETYAGDHTIAFSEKIFRALVTPVPWTVYSAKNAVKYLQTLGFDVLDDLVDHSYNTKIQDNTPYGIAKIEAFINANIELYSKLQTSNFNQIKTRCQQAANHNQQRLRDLQQQWPGDFARWLPDILLELKTAK